MRKTILAAAVALAASFGSAAAADLGGYSGSMKDDAVAYGPTTWAGLYVGASVGYAWGEAEHNYEGGYETDLDGAVYGAQLGYNWQRGNIVFGVEASLNGTDMDGDLYSGAISSELDWYATGVARLGYAFGNTMIYGLAGVAWGDVAVGFDGYHSEETHVGWTAGIGLERALSDRFTVRLEYAHVDLGSEDHYRGDCSACDVDVEFDVVKVGVNYKFGGDRHEALK